MAKNKIGYKQTEIGLIPEDWEVVRLRAIVNFSKKPRTLNLNSFGKIPFITMEMLPVEKTYINNYLLKEPDKILSGVYCEKGDILLPKITPCFENGKQGIIEDIPCDFAFATTEVYPIKPRNNLLDKMFLFYSLIKPDVRKTIADKMQGTTGRRRVPKDAVENTLIPLPSLPEQRRIAKVLSTIQRAVEQQDKIIEAIKKLKKSLMQKLFTEGLNGEEQKETEIGLIPKSWGVKRLVHVATLQRGKDLPKQNQIPGPYPIVGSSGIMGYHNEYACTGPGVVTGRSGSIGKLTYIEKDYWPHNTGLYVKNFHGNNPKFIYYILHLLDFKKYATGVSVPTLNRNFIHSALLPLPSLPEQQEIAGILSTVDTKIEIEQRRKTTLKELFKTMLHKLMTGEIRLKDVEI